MNTLEKSTTKEYFVCAKCEKKLGTFEISSGTDFLGFGGKKNLLLYCDNSECVKYGDLTIVGIKKKE